jgi:hypothetical protein
MCARTHAAPSTAARAAARSKWGDGAATIEVDDLQHFAGGEITQLADAGRLIHLGIGPDKRRRAS